MRAHRGIEEILTTRPFHTLTDSELDGVFVTETNKFSDLRWHFQNPTPGMKKYNSSIHWDMRLLDGSRLSDPQNRGFLDWCRKLVASVVFAPADGISPAPGSMVTFNPGVKWLISWMIQKGYNLPEELTPAVVGTYVEDLPGMLMVERDLEEVSESQIRLALHLLPFLWRQRRLMMKMGFQPIPHDPFYRESIQTIAKRLATKSSDWIKPLPDEVAVPIFNRAAWFIGIPSDDILNLMAYVSDPKGREEQWIRLGGKNKRQRYGIPGQSNSLRKIRMRTFLEGFRFREMQDESSPWHESMKSVEGSWSGISRLHRVRQLWEAIRDACAITIQGTTGMRISELLGIKAGIEEESGLPTGVRCEESITGLYECFLIRTILSKTETTPREVDWILGMRPKGSDDVPLALKALIILNRLSEPWRACAKTDRLFLGLNSGHSLPLPTTRLVSLPADKLLFSERRFIERWVDLSGLPDESAHKISDNDLVPWRESKGTIFGTHMLRKTWANFTLGVDSRLLPAIQMQFHHLSLAMTDGGYIGRNPLLIEALDSVSRQQRNLLIYETVTGTTLLAGRMGEQIEKATTSLREDIKGLPTSMAWKKVVEFCDENDFRIFFSPHGKCCPTRTTEMRCHKEAGIPNWLRREPNYSTREPNLCAGCACFVLDVRHKSFWEDRYIQNSISYKKANAAGMSAQFTVIKERAEQAAKLLQKIGVDIVPLDRKVKQESEGNDVTP